jgi:hypothetical protein
MPLSASHADSERALAQPDNAAAAALAAGEVILRGLGEGGRPLIIERADADFVQGTLDDLARGLDAIRPLRASDRATLQLQGGATSVLKLYHPAARVTHLALFELACNDGAYEPRLDPRSFLEGCLVIRRLSARGARRWGRDDSGARGWHPIASAEQRDEYPDPAGRPPLFRTGDAALDRELEALYGAPAFEEERTPLFLAPREVCEALGRTVAYAVIPTSSSDTSAAPPPFASGEALRGHLPSYLRDIPQAQPIGRASASVSYATIAEALAGGSDGLFLGFVSMLRQLVFEFGAFDAQPGEPARRMLRALGGVRLRFVQGEGERTQDAASFLREAADALVTGRSGSVQLPIEWPAIGTAAALEIQEAAAAAVSARIAALRPQEGRYTNPRSRYALRAFARVRHRPGCPPEVAASPESEPFCIAPWYEGKGPPTPIALPEMNMDALKRLKPNVTFAVPRELQALLDLNDPKDLADGKGKSATGLAVDWICSFSLPVITLCAFIVLNIFLQLFDIIFHWMLWLKICIPLPRPASGDE